MKKLLCITLVLILTLTACTTPLNSEKQMKESSMPPVQENYELPNGWKLQDFNIAGFDKEGPHDFGYRVTMNEKQLSRFCELMDVEKWQEFDASFMQHELPLCLYVADEDFERRLIVWDAGEFGTLISLIQISTDGTKETSEESSYIAPARVAVDAEELADELRAHIKKTSDSNY